MRNGEDRPRATELVLDERGDSELPAKERLHRTRVRGVAARRVREVVRQKASELHARALVKHHVGDILNADPAALKAESDRLQRERRVTLLAREALFLSGADDLAVSQQCGRAVVIEGRDPEDVVRNGSTNTRHAVSPIRSCRRSRDSPGGSSHQYGGCVRGTRKYGAAEHELPLARI